MSLADDYTSLLERFGMVAGACAPTAAAMPSVEEFAEEVATALNARFPGGMRPDADGTRPASTELLEALKESVLPRLDDYRHQFHGGFTRKVSQTLLEDYEHFVKQSLTAEQRLAVENVGFFEFPTASTNAHSVRSESGFLCLINSGLLELIHHAAVQFFMAAPLKHAENGSEEQTTVDFGVPDEPHRVPSIAKAAAFVAGVIYSYLRFADPDHDRTIEPDFDVSAKAGGLLELGLHIERAMGCFVVAHELAHVMLGHHEEQRNLLTPVGSLPVLSRAHEEEYEADRLATEMLVSVDRRGLYQDGAMPLACGGPAFFYVHAIIQKIERALPGASFLTQADSSHPASERRAENILSWLEREYSNSAFPNDRRSMHGVRIFSQWVKMFADLFRDAVIEPTGIQIQFSS